MTDQDPQDTAAAGGTAAPAAPAAEPPGAMVHVENPAGPTAPEPVEEVDAEPVPEFDLDLDSDDFLTAKVKLGGRPFIAREPSIATQKATIRAATEEDEAEGKSDDDDDADEVPDKTIEDALQTLKSLDSIYPQIREVLFHLDGEEKGQPPSREFVERHIRLSTFRALFRHLLGTRAEGNGGSSA